MALQGGTQLGTYKIRTRLGVGGMGEVYLASAAGPDNVEKPVAIKLIRQLHHQKQDFLAMFLEEFKVSYLLTHPNIVQTYDLGQLEGHFFLVMEYVEGITLADLLRARGPAGLPVSIALFIGSQVARGLDYAHTLKDQGGQPLNIVHRDVSPCNVLLSSSGQVKITDFGLAKSTLRREHTRSGMIKGKMSYMAPEQLQSTALDGRADLYSLGVVLYEMLGGENPFGDPEKLSPIQRFAAGELPSLGARAENLDPAITRLVDQCLAAEPDQRPESARAVGRTLDQVSRNLGLSVSDYELADFISQAREAADASPAAPHPFDRALGLELQRVQGEGEVSSFLVASTSATGERVLSSTLPGEEVRTADPLTTPPSTLAEAALLRRRSPLILFLLAAVLFGGAAAFMLFRSGTVQPAARPTTADARADSAPEPRASAARQQAPREAGAPAPDKTTGAATLQIEPTPAGARVFIDGKPAGTAPLALSDLPTDRTIRVRLTMSGRRAFQQEVRLRPGAVLALRPHLAPRTRPPRGKRPRPEPRRPGTLSINSEPWSVVTIDGARVGNTPLIGYSLPAGRHTVTLRNPPRQLSATRGVTVRPGQETKISVELSP